MVLALVVSLLAGGSVSGAAQAPTVQNARVETIQDGTPADAISRAAAPGEPVWIAWRVPMVPGERNLCSTWSDTDSSVRGILLEDPPRDGARPVFAAAADGLRLEAGTSMLVLIRVVDGMVERIRAANDDCPIDGGGRRLLWLPAVPAAASIAFLDAYLAPRAPVDETSRRIASAAVMSLALHADPAADAVLDRLLATPPATDDGLDLRSQSARWTARARGRRGYEQLARLFRGQRDAGTRRMLVAAIAETREAETLSMLRDVARSDEHEQVRGEALFAFARLAPASSLADMQSLLKAENGAAARRRGVAGLARRPAATSVPLLIELAHTSSDRVLRTEAVRALSRMRDPEAAAFLAGLLR
jgi:hypothetical protein